MQMIEKLGQSQYFNRIRLLNNLHIGLFLQDCGPIFGFREEK